MNIRMRMYNNETSQEKSKVQDLSRQFTKNIRQTGGNNTMQAKKYLHELEKIVNQFEIDYNSPAL